MAETADLDVVKLRNELQELSQQRHQVRSARKLLSCCLTLPLLKVGHACGTGLPAGE